MKFFFFLQIYPLKFGRHSGFIIFECFCKFLCILKCLVSLLLCTVGDVFENKHFSIAVHKLKQQQHNDEINREWKQSPVEDITACTELSWHPAPL